MILNVMYLVLGVYSIILFLDSEFLKVIMHKRFYNGLLKCNIDFTLCNNFEL